MAAPKTEPLVVVVVVAVAAAAAAVAVVDVADDSSKLLSTLAVRDSDRCFFKFDKVTALASKATYCGCCCCCCSC